MAGFKPVFSPGGERIFFVCLGVDGATEDDACLVDADGSCALAETSTSP
jgi:hypothetical protein